MARPSERQSGSEAATVCTLQADEQETRLALIRREIKPRVRRQRTWERGLEVDFDDAPDTEARVRAWLELERRCCSGVDWRLEPGPGGRGLRLKVSGLAPGSPEHRALSAVLGGATDGAAPPAG